MGNKIGKILNAIVESVALIGTSVFKTVNSFIWFLLALVILNKQFDFKFEFDSLLLIFMFIGLYFYNRHNVKRSLSFD